MTDTPVPSRIAAKDIITLACAIIGAAFVISGPIRSDGQRDQRLQVVETKISQNDERDEARQRRNDERDERRSDVLAKIDRRIRPRSSRGTGIIPPSPRRARRSTRRRNMPG